MSTDPRELYRKHIVEHSKNPRNTGKLEGATHSARLSNPLCGDRVKVHLQVDGDIIRAVRFEARGCAIATASASMMTEWLEGRSLSELPALREAVDAAVSADGGEVEPPADALMALRAFPTREKCATLAWDALDKALQG